MSETITLFVSTPRYDAASAAYDVIYDAHARDLDAMPVHACKCGRTFRTSQAFGLHMGAIRRSADRAFDAALKTS